MTAFCAVLPANASGAVIGGPGARGSRPSRPRGAVARSRTSRSTAPGRGRRRGRWRAIRQWVGARRQFAVLATNLGSEQTFGDLTDFGGAS